MNNWNKPRKRTTDRDCVTPEKKKKERKGAASHQRPRWWIAKTAAATGNIQDWQESTTVEQLLFWDCKTNNDFYGHNDDGLFAIKANNQAMTLLPARNRRASQLTISHKTHLQQQPSKSRVPSQRWCRSLQDRLFDDSRHCKQRVSKMSQRQHRDEKHMYRWKKKRNRIPKWKKISCLTCQSLFHFSRAMFSLDNEPVNVRVFLFANNLSPDSKASSLPRVKTSFSHRNIVEVDRILNEQRDFMLFRARKARCVDERLDSGSVAQRSGLRESYDWVDLRCLYASENRGKISRGKIRRKMSNVGRASGNFGVGHPKFQPGTFVPGSRFANRASLDANRAMCPVCPVLEWPLI